MKELKEINQNECRYPVDEKNNVHLFCAQKTEKGVYCKKHWDLCHSPNQLDNE